MAALTNGSLKFLWTSEIAWYHCSNQTISFSFSVPENWGIPGIVLCNVKLIGKHNERTIQ